MDALIRSAAVTGVRRLRPSSAPTVADGAAAGPESGVPAAADRIAELEAVLAQERSRHRAELAELADAHERAARTRAETAAADAEAVRAVAAERGRAEGEAAGAAAGRARLEQQAERLNAVLAQLTQARRAVLDEAEDTVVETVLAALARLLGSAAASRAMVRATVQACVERSQAGAPLKVAVHPDDVAGLDLDGLPAGVELVAAANVELGGCLVETPAGTLDARLETQFRQLGAALRAARVAARPDEEL